MSHADNLLNEYDRINNPTRRRDIVAELVQIIREYDGELDRREERLDELTGAFQELCYDNHVPSDFMDNGRCMQM